MRYWRASIFTALLATTTMGCRSDRGSQTLTSDADLVLNSLPPAARTAFEAIQKSPYYHRPTYQDCVVGFSISPEFPFILSPRRQTDGLTRQLYSLIPQEARDTWAYMIPDRIVQNPEKYLAYLSESNRRKGYIIGSVAGSSSESQCKTNEEELLVLTYKLIRGIGYPTKDIRIMYSKGDSPGNTAEAAIAARAAERIALDAAVAAAEAQIAAQMSPQVTTEQSVSQRISSFAKAPQVRLTWGADELAMLAFANVLVPMTMSVTTSNPNAPQHYEADESITKVVAEKAIDADLTVVDESMSPNIRLVIHSGGVDASWDPFPTASNVAYVDRRAVANGAEDALWLPTKRCNALAYAAWGTSANSIGSAMATSKIVHMAGSESARKRLLLEAIAHDIFFIGYSERDKLSSALAKVGVKYSYNARERIPESQVDVAFQTITDIVRESMNKQFAGTQCLLPTQIQVRPQIKRFFEAETNAE